MKRLLKLTSFLFLFSFACNSKDSSADVKRTDDLDVGRNFVRATLDGDYGRARTMILQDSSNIEWLSGYERSYNERMTADDKKKYKEASINVHELRSLNDSTSLLIYSNSYFKNDTHHLKLVRINQQWLVDFKSYFENRDSLLKDSTFTTK
jgi:hypothetical protein